MIKENCVVISTKGKDINQLYICVKVENNFAYLTNGKSRNLSNLKKKNLKHIKFICKCENFDFKSVQNCDIILWLKNFKQTKGDIYSV